MFADLNWLWTHVNAVDGFPAYFLLHSGNIIRKVNATHSMSLTHF
jgi:hypothetical protein